MLIIATSGKQPQTRVMVMQSLCSAMPATFACTISVSGTRQTAAGWFMHKLAGVFVLIRWQILHNNNGQSGSF
jgi:hypothetical protein